MSKVIKMKEPSVVRTYDQDGFRKRAACLCVNDDETKVLLVTSRKDDSQWIVPGGGVEPDETPATAAVREVQEEAGVSGNLGRCLGMFENIDRGHRTNVYVLVVTEELEDWDESRTFGRHRRWFTVEAAVAALHKPLQSNYVKLLLPASHQYQQQQPPSPLGPHIVQSTHPQPDNSCSSPLTVSPTRTHPQPDLTTDTTHSSVDSGQQDDKVDSQMTTASGDCSSSFDVCDGIISVIDSVDDCNSAADTNNTAPLDAEAKELVDEFRQNNGNVRSNKINFARDEMKGESCGEGSVDIPDEGIAIDYISKAEIASEQNHTVVLGQLCSISSSKSSKAPSQECKDQCNIVAPSSSLSTATSISTG